MAAASMVALSRRAAVACVAMYWVEDTCIVCVLLVFKYLDIPPLHPQQFFLKVIWLGAYRVDPQSGS